MIRLDGILYKSEYTKYINQLNINMVARNLNINSSPFINLRKKLNNFLSGRQSVLKLNFDEAIKLNKETGTALKSTSINQSERNFYALLWGETNKILQSKIDSTRSNLGINSDPENIEVYLRLLKQMPSNINIKKYSNYSPEVKKAINYQDPTPVYSINNFKLPSDTSGSIKNLFISSNNKFFILNLLKSTRNDITLKIVTPLFELADKEKSINNYLKTNGLSEKQIQRVQFIAVNKSTSNWIRDAFVLLQNKSLKLITMVPTNSINKDFSLAKETIDFILNDNIAKNDLKYYFEQVGGQIVTSNSYVFIRENEAENFNYFYKENKTYYDHINSLNKFFKKLDYLKKRYLFKKITDKKIIDFKGINTPSGHIDLWLTPINDKTVFLANPVEGYKIMHSDKNKKNIILNFIQSTIKSGLLLDERSQKNINYINSFLFKKYTTEDLQNLQEKYNSTRNYLEKKGFNVISLPMIIDDKNSFTYNNVLMDFSAENNFIDKKNKSVLLPSYGLPLDTIAKQKWEQQGFQVKQIPMNNSAFDGGSIRCMTQREAY